VSLASGVRDAVQRLRARLFGRPMSEQSRAALRRAARVALVMPPAFATSSLLIHDAQTTTFVAFGSFALLVLADFGGLRRPRAIAYLVTTAVGAGLIAAGTLASNSPWSAVAVTLVLAFGVRFAGAFGGYIRAAQGALLLSLVLAVAFPGPPATIVPRLTGWLIAGILSTLAAVLLWPRFEHVKLRHRSATGCLAMADLVTAARQPDEAEIDRRAQTAADTVSSIFRDYAATPARPAWPTRSHRALAELVIELDSTIDFAVPSFKELAGKEVTGNELTGSTAEPVPAGRPWIEEGDRLAAVLVQTLRSCADVLTGGAAPDLAALDAAQAVHRQSLERWAGEAVRSGVQPRRVLDQLRADNALTFISYLILAIGIDAMAAAGREPPANAPARLFARHKGGSRGTARRVVKSLRTHLAPSSPVLHDSARVAIGFALAVLVGLLLELSHAFWVVLGTSSALRSNVLATGRTALQAVAGTFIGVIVGTAFIALVGTNALVAWLVFPVAAFTATFVAGAAGFVIGQAAFSVFVIVLFTLIAPAGLSLGLVRIEDVAVGVGISIVTGLLLWPRGTRHDLTEAVARLFGAAAAFLGESLELLLGRGSSQSAYRARALAVRARDLADDALEQFLAERSAGPLGSQGAASLVASGTHVLLFGDLIDVLTAMGYRAGRRAAGLDALEAQVRALVDELRRQAGRIEGRNGERTATERVSGLTLREVSLAALRGLRDDPSAGRSTIAIVGASDWVRFLDTLVARLERPIDEAVAAARLPWWR
jgi:uncharacterized membrane protein YccC